MFRLKAGVWLGLVLAAMILTTTVSAHTFGGKWDWSSVIWCSESQYTASVQNATADWNALRGDWPYLYHEDDCAEFHDVTIIDYELPGAEYGFVWIDPAPETGPYVAGEMYLNTAEITDAANQRYVATHEWGHLLGLAHNCTTSVMAGGDWCFVRYSTIKAHDTQDLNALY